MGIFFPLSGFLIATLLLEEKIRAAQRGEFSHTPFHAIYPAYLIVVLAIVLLSIFHLPEESRGFISAIPGVLTFVDIPHYIDGAFNRSLSDLWTLQIEMAFYLLIPVGMLLLGQKIGLLTVSTAMVVLSIMAFFRFPLLSPAPIYCGHLALGALLSVVWKFGWFDRYAVKAIPLAFFSLAGIGGLLCLPLSSELPWTMEIFAATLCGCGLIAAFLLQPSLPVLPGAPWIGRISYSLYLIHASCWTIAWARLHLEPFLFATSSWPFSTMATFLTVLLCLSVLSYRGIEQPAIRLGKHIAAAITRPRRPSPAQI